MCINTMPLGLALYKIIRSHSDHPSSLVFTFFGGLFYNSCQHLNYIAIKGGKQMGNELTRTWMVAAMA
jgi:hypothetical protein